MSNYSSLSDLAAKIQSATATIDAYLKTNNLPTPSFHEDGPVDFGLNSEETVKALETAKASAQELVDLLDGPALNLRPTVCLLALLITCIRLTTRDTSTMV